LTARGAVILVTGWQASGKSTIAPMLAARFPLSAHVEGDVFFGMPVSGRENMTREPTDEAVRQLELRYRAGAMVADLYARAGFTAVHTDIVMAESLEVYPSMIETRPLYVIALHPSATVLAARERNRGTTRERDWPAIDEEAAHYHAEFDRSPRLGAWLDTSGQTPEETVEEIMSRLDEARVDD
jgi:chloramphenicol 3-O-phosphotransferase